MAAPFPPPATSMEAFKPSPALAACVTDIWVWQLSPAALQGPAAMLTLLPDGHPTLCFVYGEPLTASDGRQSFTTRSAVCGFQARPVHVSCSGHAAGITVRLQPWGLARFLPPLPAEAAQRRIACRDIFARHAVETLESQLFELPTSLARVRQVERFLLGMMREPADERLVRCAVARLSGGQDAMRMAQMAREYGATERTLERHFLRAVGVPPKLFARVMRLQAALATRESPPSWSEHALAQGFYDQAHLNRETRALFDTTPSTLLKPPASPIAQGFLELGRKTALAATLFR